MTLPKSCLPVLALFLSVFCNPLQATVTVTPAPNGGSLCADGAYHLIGNIVISEGANGDFNNSNNQTYEMSAPAGFEFEAGTGTITVSGTGLSLDGSQTSITATKVSFRYDASMASTSAMNSITIAGLKVKALGPGTGNILRTGGNATQPGNAVSNMLNHGSLTGLFNHNASFNYLQTNYCKTGSDPVPVITGTPGGTFSATIPTGKTLNYSMTTGVITLAGSSPGTYTMTYSVGTGPCSDMQSDMVTIVEAPVADFSYANSSYCKNGTDPTIMLGAGAVIGTLSSLPAGLVFTATPGKIDLSMSAAGNYAITNTVTATGCPNDVKTFVVSILPAADASFDYLQSSYCKSGSDPVPVITGTPGGTFSATVPAGKTLNYSTSTGAITLMGSSPGMYTMTYMVGTSPCTAMQTDMVTIVAEPIADFSYANSSYCRNGTDPGIMLGTDAVIGTLNSMPAGLAFVTGMPGKIDLSMSTPGSYAITNTVTAAGCPNDVETFVVTILPAANAAFNYPQDRYCLSGSNPVPSITGSSGGMFSYSPLTTGAALSLNPSTGLVNLTPPTTAGRFEITYTLTGTCGDTKKDTITIDPVPSAGFSYGGPTAFCQDGTDPTPVANTGATIGTLSYLPATGLSLLANDKIDLSASTPGTYLVTNTVTGNSCGMGVSTQLIQILPTGNASFDYPQTNYCQSGASAVPIITGNSGGMFSYTGPGILSIDPLTGVINPAASPTIGNYVITYTISGNCPATQTDNISIVSVPSAAFSYPKTIYCQNEVNPAPTANPGGQLGAFDASPAGLAFVTGSPGVIDLAGSMVGTYTVINTVSLSGCPPAVNVFNVTIFSQANVTFTYPADSFCQNQNNPLPMVSVPGGTYTSTTALFENGTNTSTIGVVDLQNSPTGMVHVISYTVTSGACSVTSTETVKVLSVPANPVVSISGICQLDPIPNPVITSGTNLKWYSGLPPGPANQIPVADPANPTGVELGFSNTNVGNQTVYVTQTGAGCPSGTTPLTLQVGTLPNINLFAVPSGPVCQGDTVTFQATGASSFVYFLNNDSVKTGNIFSIDTLQNGNTIHVEGTQSGCLANSDTFSAIVNPLPQISLIPNFQTTFRVSDAPFNLNQLIATIIPNTGFGEFIGTGVAQSGPNQYQFNPQQFSSDTTVKIQYNHTSGQGCMSTDTISFSLITASTVPAILDTTGLTIPNNSAICKNSKPLAITYNPLILPARKKFCSLRVWDISIGGYLSGGANPLMEITPNSGIYTLDPNVLSPGNYYLDVLAVDTNGVCTNAYFEGFITFTIKPIPAPPVIVDPTTPYCITNVDDVLYVSNYSLGNQYQWYDTLGNSLGIVTADSFDVNIQAVPPDNMAEFSVSAILNGCYSNKRDTVILTVFGIPPNPMPVPPPEYCTGEAIAPLMVNGLAGATFLWYDDLNGMPTTTTSTSFITNVSSTIAGKDTFYVAQNLNGSGGFSGCTSGTAPVIVTVKSRPFPPNVNPVFESCTGDSLADLTVNAGSNILWYANPAMPSIAMGPSFATGLNINNPVDTVFYVTQTSDNCESGAAPVNVIIYPQPLVTFAGLDDPFYCTSPSPIQLAPSPIPNQILGEFGIFAVIDSASGDTITGAVDLANVFHPDIAGIGTKYISYNFQDFNQCSDRSFDTLTIYASPQVDFLVDGLCFTDSLRLKDLSFFRPVDSSATGFQDAINQWKWEYYNLKDTIPEVIRPNLAVGFVDIDLTISTNRGCSSTDTRTVFVGSNPMPDFSWKGTCEGDSTIFIGLPTALSAIEAIDNFTWDFGAGPQSTGVLLGDSAVLAKHVFAPGVYDVTFTLAARDPDSVQFCSASRTHTVYILRSELVEPGDPYQWNFEAGTDGWEPQPNLEGSAYNWQWGTPTGSVINTQATGPNKAWVTNLNGTYYRSENSWVNSPCFDLSQLNRPMISMDIWSHTPNGRDGAVLQVSLDGGLHWPFIIGEIGTGLQWYNQNTISAKPGNQPFGKGWSGEDSGWRNARHKLDNFIGEKSVRFRVAFASDNSHLLNPGDTVYNGFAFDNLFIGERSRNVLLEHFTNTDLQLGRDANAHVYNLMATPNNFLDVIPVEYHISGSGTGDVFHLLNPDDPDARAFQYGISNINNAALNGNLYQPTTSLLSRQIDTLALKDPGFFIELGQVTVGLPGDSLRATAIVTANKIQLPGEEIFVHFAVIEDSINNGQYQSVMRKMLPNNGGQPFLNGQPFVKGSRDTLKAAWFLDPSKYTDREQLEVVAFVQNLSSNRVFQATSSRTMQNGVATAIVDEGFSLESGLKVYPNPATDQVNVSFAEPLPESLHWQLTDLRGSAVMSGNANPGTLHFHFETQGLTPGIYTLGLRAGDRALAYKKLVILRR